MILAGHKPVFSGICDTTFILPFLQQEQSVISTPVNFNIISSTDFSAVDRARIPDLLNPLIIPVFCILHSAPFRRLMTS
jgi:hypothetical protein